MKITVNLATRPFIELRPIFLRLRIFMAVLAVLAVGALVAGHILQRRLDAAKAQIDAVHAQVVAAQDEKRKNERRMREPENAAVLARAHFLNALFLRKSFSWTAIMMDLETVLPAGVQVTSIEPEPTSDGDVMIRLRVSGDRDRAVQLVRNLERSKRFLAPRLTGEATQAKEAGSQGNNFAANGLAPSGVEFEILANYNPLPPGESYASPKAVRKDSDTDADQPGSAAGSGRHRGAAMQRKVGAR
jgi:type IV pilus assembly protein PilN